MSLANQMVTNLNLTILVLICLFPTLKPLEAQEPQKASWTSSPYRNQTDSPFASLPFSYFYLEDFESGALHTAGVSLNRGPLVIGDKGYPSKLVDSVDGDDGTLDGSGSAGHSLWSGNTNASLVFTFDAETLGSLPTHVGLVWTDSLGPVHFSLTAFDATGQAVAKVGPIALGDGVITGTVDEDLFLGLYYPGGIARLACDNLRVNFEIDHLQYGLASPCRECAPVQRVQPE
jgi:hypothetical protein